MEHENTRKRKINGQDSSNDKRIPSPANPINGYDDDFLTLSLSSYYHTTPPPPPFPAPPPHQIIPPPPQPTDPHLHFHQTVLPPPPPQPPHAPPRQPRVRRRPNQPANPEKTDTVPPPYPWATNRRATVHTVEHLLNKLKIASIDGEVQCKKCDQKYRIEYDLREKFYEIGSYVAKEKTLMKERAPSNWLNPSFPNCRFCDAKSSVRPVMADKKKAINWLFLLLGEFLGCCTLDQLKYFCKHTKNHRTGAKDRVLFLTYLGICKQLDPNGPFDR